MSKPDETWRAHADRFNEMTGYDYGRVSGSISGPSFFLARAASALRWNVDPTDIRRSDGAHLVP